MVFYIAVAIIVLFVIWGGMAPDQLAQLTAEALSFTTEKFGWFSMLFSAGMGIGLVFWGVAEPIHHFFDPPLESEALSPEAARLALRYSFFHWGLHVSN